MNVSLKVLVIGGLAVALLLALLAGPLASDSPDGLEKVAEENGLMAGAAEHGFSGSPLADYSVRGVDGDSLGTGLSGIIGVLLTFAAGYGLFTVVRSKSTGRE